MEAYLTLGSGGSHGSVRPRGSALSRLAFLTNRTYSRNRRAHKSTSHVIVLYDSNDCFLDCYLKHALFLNIDIKYIEEKFNTRDLKNISRLQISYSFDVTKF